MNGLQITDEEMEELYSLLKPREASLPRRALSLLFRIEKSLYARLTVEELEALVRRFASGV